MGTGAEPRPGAHGSSVLAAVVQGAFFVGYPFLVYAAYRRLGTRGLGVALLLLYAIGVAVRARGRANEAATLLRQHLPLALLIGLGIATGARPILLLLPMAVSLYLLFTFAASLRNGPPMIERFARLVEDDLPDFTLPYCRRVTLVWCVFLGANALVIAALAFAAPVSWWAAYTGLGFYLLMGALLFGEFCVRKLWFRYYQQGPGDRLLARLFPAEHTANGRRSLAYQAQRELRTASERTPAKC
jgi:uncharacterized membrane protein